jgi:hypothetical protein|tara:strand:- start:213 stop:377 length:165 start_codon:yes stop_codon:yes gene_type:complete
MVSGMGPMAMGPPPGDVKIVKCKECGVEVTVNAEYPIQEVECRDYYCPKNDKNV